MRYSITDVALERDVEGDLLLGDLGQGLPFRAGAFDGAVSISALQWLCNADKSSHHPAKRLYTFFSSLYACMVISFFLYFFFSGSNSDYDVVNLIEYSKSSIFLLHTAIDSVHL